MSVTAILRQWFGNAQNLRLQSSDWTERDFLAIMPFSTGLSGQSPARSEELNRLLRDLLLRVSRLECKLELLSASEVPSRAQPWPKSADQESLLPTSLPTATAREGSTSSPDLEARIGSQWLNRVGIVAVLVGVSLFLKYAFEGKWVGPPGRVLIGLLV